ncbi:MAG: hypothetical protein AAGJ93_04335 [Bacteroidota bacterium]
MNKSHIDFTIFQYPDANSSLPGWRGTGKAGILVLFPQSESSAEDEAFLANILKAAQLTPLEEQVYLCHLSPQTRLNLPAVCRQHQIHTVLLFGCDLSTIGVQAELPWYHFLKLGDLSLLRSHSLTTIREERAKEKNEKAGALWRALKAKYL